MDAEALERTSAEEISNLTRRATGATYHAEGLSKDELAFIERVIRIAPNCVAEAARNPHQHLVVSILDGRLAGFVIATVHAKTNRELDWLMVDPAFHGGGIASPLMCAGMAWLGKDQAMWLNVVRHNQRAIQFYRKHGFEIDPEAVCAHVMPHVIMKRGS